MTKTSMINMSISASKGGVLRGKRMIHSCSLDIRIRTYQNYFFVPCNVAYLDKLVE
ncbi:hypothetical protein GQ55_8G257600 [Panicum hallii var. hallii]|uniref:Uncharacterized protein n=1 Tax=Panicum hallii var. hallii TaxID=1504633 RepID=A0A2T7CR82_9POAL|nr:hypothetical protein GQ55_8G257600 [Panicum hallii var. hallii]